MTEETIGRPTVMTAETIAKLEDGFIKGLGDVEACLYADIGVRTLYDFCEAHPDFSHRKEQLKDSVKMRARLNVAEGIQKGDKLLSQWYLERRDADFKPKSATDLTTKGDKISSLSQVPTNELENIAAGGEAGTGKEGTSAPKP